VAEFDIRLLPAIDERWKRMADCDVHEKVRPQDGRILVKLADCGKTVDLRVSFLHAVLGPSLCARVLDPDVVRPLDLEGIGYADRDRERLVRAIGAPWGLVIAAGPTGCGKTTTLYACVNRLAGPERKIMTVENPVEFLLPWVVQTSLRPRDGVTFPIAVRSCLRSAPNVILIGELRDRETAEMACRAALTGHLVLTTLHANDAPLALVRLVEMCVDPFLVGHATRLVLAQRLIRKLCPACSKPTEPPASRLAEAAELVAGRGLDWAGLPKRFYGPVGCDLC
jgi:type II secretory ATPase GspE/PulE/Tfp pilus assembly ATPase PilB-like protein